MVSDVHNLTIKLVVHINYFFRAMPHKNRNILVKETNMSCVVLMMVRDKDAVHIRPLIRKISEPKHPPTVQPRDLRHQTKLEKTLQTISLPRLKMLVKKVLAETERLAEIKVDFSVLVLQKNLVSADLARAAVECYFGYF